MLLIWVFQCCRDVEKNQTCFKRFIYFLDVCWFCQGPAWRLLQWVRRGSGGFRNCLTSPVLNASALRAATQCPPKSKQGSEWCRLCICTHGLVGTPSQWCFGIWWWKSWREIRKWWMKAKIYSGSISKQCWDMQICSLKGSRKEMSMNCRVSSFC